MANSKWKYSLAYTDVRGRTFVEETHAKLYPDFVLAMTGYLLLVFWNAPPLLVVLLCAGASGLSWG